MSGEEKKKIISENEIKWTSGSNKSYGEAVYEWWENRLGNNPDRSILDNLEEERDMRVEKADELLDQRKKESKRRQRVRLKELARMYRDSANKLTSLLEDSGKTVLQKKKRGRKLKKPEIKSRVMTYFKEHRERLEKENRDEKGHLIEKHLSVQIINELDEELNINSEYSDAPRTITGWIYGK